MLKLKDPQREISELMDAVLALRTPEEAKAFFDDLCTLNEVNAIAQRLQVAKLLRSGRTFSEVVERTGASTATISRVNRCLQAGPGGYAAVLSRLEEDAIPRP